MRTAFVSIFAMAAAVGVSAQQPAPAPNARADMNQRGAEVMGFDQEKTTHHFYLYADGGAIDVSVKGATDRTDLDAIR